MILSLWLAGSSALAAEVIPLAEGEPAPFAGQLIRADAAIRLGQKAERCDFLRELDGEKNRIVCDVNIQLAQEKGRIDLEAARARERVLIQAAERRFWEHPVFVAALSAIATYGILRAAKELRP